MLFYTVNANLPKPIIFLSRVVFDKLSNIEDKILILGAQLEADQNNGSLQTKLVEANQDKDALIDFLIEKEIISKI